MESSASENKSSMTVGQRHTTIIKDDRSWNCTTVRNSAKMSSVRAFTTNSRRTRLVLTKPAISRTTAHKTAPVHSTKSWIAILESSATWLGPSRITLTSLQKHSSPRTSCARSLAILTRKTTPTIPSKKMNLRSAQGQMTYSSASTSSWSWCFGMSAVLTTWLKIRFLPYRHKFMWNIIRYLVSSNRVETELNSCWPSKAP